MVLYYFLLFIDWLNPISNSFSVYTTKSFAETPHFSQIFYFSSSFKTNFIEPIIKMQTELASEIIRHFSFAES